MNIQFDYQMAIHQLQQLFFKKCYKWISVKNFDKLGAMKD